MTELSRSTSNAANRQRIHWIARAGMLTAVAVVLQYLEVPIVFMPDFLKFDFSEVAVLLGAFSMGPVTAIMIELIKNLIHVAYKSSATGGVGELANFLIGSLFVGTAGLIYRWNKTRRGAFLAMAIGTLVMTAGACLINYFFMLPFYINVMHFPLEALIGMTQKVGNKLVVDLKTMIFYVFVPFNLFKGIVVSLLVSLLYKRLSPLLHR
jgi:riboflavin transporter FmnP